MATSLHFQYLPQPVTSSSGTAYQLLATTGTRTFTNRFGDSTTTAVGLGLEYADNLLFVNQSIPVDSNGIRLTVLNGSPIQLPGLGPTDLFDSVVLYDAPGYVIENDAGRVDTLGTAYLSSLPGFRNVTIGASNLNALAPNYQTCTAPITFTNGLRPPFQPTASSSALRFIYSYFISDGVSYSINATLYVTASTQFATTFDQLGNAYQTVTNITGTRVYTYLPAGERVSSVITGLVGPITAEYQPMEVYYPDQRFYPYAYLTSSPGVYTMNTAPLVDGDGLAYSFSPPSPPPGEGPGTSDVDYEVTNVFVQTSVSSAVLLEDAVDEGAYYHRVTALLSLQQQSLRLLL